MSGMIRLLLALISGLAISGIAHAAAPSVKDALALRPVQTDVEYDRPNDAQIKDCTITSEELGGRSGWVVRGPVGQLFRCFADTNGDNKVDQWCYYHNGIEAYRDLDTDFNGKADQYRWLGLAGTRWGLDANEDGRIDSWKTISAEEVTSEIVASVRERDPRRFAAVLLSPTELRDLGLGPETQAKIGKSIDTAVRRFDQLSRTQRTVDRDTIWMHFGATRPGIMPAGTGGSTRDVTVYENVVAMLEIGKKHDQLGIGTLVKVGDSWRAIDVPTGLLTEQESLAASSYLLQAGNPATNPARDDSVDEAEVAKQQELAAKLEKAEKRLSSAPKGPRRDAAYDEILALYRELANNASGPKERASWIQQMADTLGTASQTEDYAKATARLEELDGQLARIAPRDNLTGYVRFRLMNAKYASALNAEDADFDEIQEDWLTQLTEFVTDFPNCEDTVEAMFDLAIGEEFNGNEEDAITWYKKITRAGKPNALVVRKAAGAVARLESVGKPLTIQGRTVDGKNFSTQQLSKRLVLVQYWATFSEASTADIQRIGELVKEYRGAFIPISISLDTDVKALDNFLREAKIGWPVLYEKGGLDSRLAIQMGVLTVPTMMLIDGDGKVVNRNLQISELESILKKQLAAKPKPRG